MRANTAHGTRTLAILCRVASRHGARASRESVRTVEVAVKTVLAIGQLSGFPAVKVSGHEGPPAVRTSIDEPNQEPARRVQNISRE